MFIDSIKGIEQYIDYIKPFHCKVLDSIIEIAWNDTIDGTIDDCSYVFDLSITESRINNLCLVDGYGVIFDSSDDGVYKLVQSFDSATNSITVDDASEFIGSNKLTILKPDDSVFQTIVIRSIVDNTIISADYIDFANLQVGMRVYKGKLGFSEDFCITPQKTNELYAFGYIGENLVIVET